MRRPLTRWCLLLAAVLVLSGAAFAGQDTWTGVERIVAVGDVHGDFDQFVKVLRAAGVVDEKNNWKAGKTHLVQTGDVLDRGGNSRKAMDLLMKLETQAAKAGGAVHALIGNHEAMVLLGDWRYVHRGEVESFGSAAAFREAMGPKGRYGRWIRSHNTIIRINDTVFVHAGISRVLQDYCGKYKSEQGLKTGLKWLDSIEESEAARLHARNPHELMRSLEALSRITVARMIIHASLGRKASSRVMDFHRLDHPEVDPPEWNKFVTVEIDGGGEVQTGELSFKYWLEPPYAPSYEENYERHSGLGGE